jgi:mannose-6-phosphate isomerase-like protein (cupin superfamily)
MHLINNDEAKTFHFIDFVQQTLAGPETGLKNLEVWLMTLKAGGESPPYHHPGETVWIILKGGGRAWVDGEEVKVGPNTTVSIPTGASRQLFNHGTEELVMLTVRGITRPQQAVAPERGLGL